VEPAEEGKAIRIDQVRALHDFIALTSQYGRCKVAVIAPAEQMNPFAAASLLKTLEEPTPGSVLILVAERPAALLPTIRSRCQQVAFPVPSPAMAGAWLCERLGPQEDIELLLDMNAGAPLAAAAMAAEGGVERRQAILQGLAELLENDSDPVIVAEQWLKWGLERTLTWVRGCVDDLIRLRSVPEHPRVAQREGLAHLQGLTERLDLRRLFWFSDQVADAARLADTQANQQMLLEDLLILWSGLSASPPRGA
jgi:DNA polymerase-3 subunit delta'